MKRFAFALLAVIAGCAVLPSNSLAAGGTYDVVFCHELHRLFGGTIDSTNSFSARSRCSDPQSNSVTIDNVERTAEGRSAEAYWQVDDPLGITGVQVDARLRRANGYRSALYMADGNGHETHTVAVGDTSGDGSKPYAWEGQPQRRFVASLECGQSPSCAASEHARTWVQNVRLTVADEADPEVEVDGSLLDGGWLRGLQELGVRTTDTGAGVSRVEVEVDSEALASQDALCSAEISDGLASAYVPCPPSAQVDDVRSTAEPPFSNGENEITACAVDFAGNDRCEARTVRIDNELPTTVFSQQNPHDPELIRAPVSDEYSGLSTGAIYFRSAGETDWRPLFTQKIGDELRARVDSESEAPGTYEFMAIATDVAGNASQTTFRDDGLPMTLEFPLKSGVDLNAQLKPGGSKRTVLSYGKGASVHGRLLDAAGEPLAGMAIEVDEDFGEGALIDHRIRTVLTDQSGRWSAKLPAGPTRSVSVAYEGDQRYLETSLEAGRMVVRTGAKLGLTRKRVAEGNATTFTGRIERLGARIPSRGKLVQIQYQDPVTGRWATVRNPFRTGSDGRFRFKYGFGTHYVQDVAIRFRLKVPTEQGWPYRGTHSGPRRVIVEARR